MKICVFCSANAGIDPDFFRMTEELGTWIGENGHSLVFGGCNLGLMDCVACAVRRAGGMTVGVIPTIVEKNGRKSEHTEVEVLCDNLSDRKDLMLAQSDVIVALPGGVGTLDEIFTVAASASIGYHHKRVILYNMKGFWNSLLALIADLKAKGVIREGFDDTILTANTLEELTELINA